MENKIVGALVATSSVLNQLMMKTAIRRWYCRGWSANGIEYGSDVGKKDSDNGFCNDDEDDCGIDHEDSDDDDSDDDDEKLYRQ